MGLTGSADVRLPMLVTIGLNGVLTFRDIVGTRLLLLMTLLSVFMCTLVCTCREWF